MQVFNYDDPYKKLLEDKTKEPYLFPDYETDLDILYGESFSFYPSDMNKYFKMFEEKHIKYINWNLDTQYIVNKKSLDTISLFDVSNKKEYLINYDEDYSDYAETMLCKYMLECIDKRYAVDFSGIIYAKQDDVKSITRLLEAEDTVENFNGYPKDRLEDELSEYYLRLQEDHGQLSFYDLDEITKLAYNQEFINDSQRDQLYEIVETKDLNTIGIYVDGINAYTKVCHEKDPIYNRSNSIEITHLVLGYGYQYEIEDYLDEHTLSYDNCEYWVYYTNSEEVTIKNFDELIDAYDPSSKRSPEVRTVAYYSVILYIEKEDYIKILNDLSIPSNNNDFLKTKNILSTKKNRFPITDIKSFEKKIQYIDSPNLYRIAMILGKKFNYDINKKISVTDFKKLAISDRELSLFASSQDMKDFIANKSSSFSINDMVKVNVTPNYGSNSLFSYLVNVKGLDEKDFLSVNVVTEWKSPLQRVFKEDTNYTFQLNIKRELLPDVYEGLNIPESNRRSIDTFTSIHPIQPPSSKYLTLAFIRYTVNPEYEETVLNAVVMDEIQSDYDKKSRFGSKAMKNWEYIILKKFVSYVRKNLGYDKIYMPTSEFKNRPSSEGGYGANVPEFTANKLYVDLPKGFGFKPSKYEDFVLLEKTKK